MNRFFVLFLFFYVALFSTFSSVNAQDNTNIAVNGQLPSREEMREQLLGKTRNEVLKKLGKPDRTWEGMFKLADGRITKQFWCYDHKNIDSLTGKKDIMSVHLGNENVVIYIQFTTSPKQFLLQFDPKELDKKIKPYKQ